MTAAGVQRQVNCENEKLAIALEVHRHDKYLQGGCLCYFFKKKSTLTLPFNLHCDSLTPKTSEMETS